MSRNPYLAASRPASSFTRSSRSSGRSAASTGGILGRSRSSAGLSSYSSQFSSATGSSYASPSSYVPISSWQRSSSSTRSNTKYGTSDPTTDQSMGTQKKVSCDSDNSSGISRALHRSASSQYLKQPYNGTNDDDGGLDTSHLKNYQQSKIQQPTQSPTTRTLRSSMQSLDSTIDTASTNNRRSATSIDASDSEPIGDNIPSASARHLRTQNQLTKSKSVELSSNQQNEAPLLSSSMSVDRLLLRAESMGERDLRKSFKELVMENERLKQQLKGFDDKDKQRQQEWIRTERQLQRKISELEEENRQIEQWKQEIQRLKEENNSLIRVVSKLSKH